MTLRGLIEAVEAGRWDHDAASAWLWTKPGQIYGWAMEAFGGSLDAAKRLHDALLPGWKVAGIHQEDRGLWWVELRRGHITSYDKVIVAPHHFNAPTPARAWLLAILRALDEREGGE